MTQQLGSHYFMILYSFMEIHSHSINRATVVRFRSFWYLLWGFGVCRVDFCVVEPLRDLEGLQIRYCASRKLASLNQLWAVADDRRAQTRYSFTQSIYQACAYYLVTTVIFETRGSFWQFSDVHFKS